MSIEVSVLMISYNNYPLNLFSLYALENQTFDHSKFEVILVDDASTDQTSSLRNYHSSFKFKYIRCKQNKGRSTAKNIGVEASQGKILIIIDSEMILDPDYVKEHYLQHQTEDNLVITGCANHFNTYTLLNRRFNKEQFRKYYNLRRKKKSKWTSKNFTVFMENLDALFHKDEIINLVTKESIQKLKYKNFAFPTPFYPKIIRRFGTNYQGFTFPWIFVITHNISLKRSLFDAVGPFYKGFNGYGCEDWEFGYRLYKYGAKIIDNPNVKIYHQEHPRNLKNQYKDSLNNYLVFFKKHRNFDVGVQALCWIGKNFFDVNNLILEYNSVVRKYPHQFEHLVKSFNEFLERVLTLLINDQPVTKLLEQSNLNKNQQEKLIAEMKLLRTLGIGPQLVNTLDQLLKK